MTTRACGIATLVLVASVGVAAGGQAPISGPTETLDVEEFGLPAPDADYPELRELGYLNDRPSFGIAFSGGGTRAATATWGQLRALHELGWLDQARYLSAVSGGAWTVIPFMFLPDDPGDRDPCDPSDPPSAADARARDGRFLEAYRAPADLEVADLTHKTADGSFIETLSKTPILTLFLSRFLLWKDETYSLALGKRFLDKIGQYDNPPGSPDGVLAPKFRYFAADCAQRNRIAGRSPDLTEDDFTVMTADRPFLIAGSSLIAKKRFAKKDRDFFPVEITPMYTGVPEGFTLDSGSSIGGGWAESPAYDSFARHDGGQPSIARVVKPRKTGRWTRHQYRFTLSDVMGATGAAPARLIRAIGWNLIGFPEFRHFAIGVPADSTIEYAHGDGGHIDNLGLTPLLRRGTMNILVFVNSQRAFLRKDGIWTFDRQLRAVFEEEGWLADQDETRQALLEPRGLIQIVDSFEKRKAAGRPLVHCGKFRALTNRRQMIREYEPQICWVYLDRTRQWLEALPDDHKLFRSLKTEPRNKLHKFHGFPHYKTFFQRGWKGRVIDLGEEQVNAMAHLTAWAVMEERAYLGRGLGLIDQPVGIGRSQATPESAPERERR